MKFFIKAIREELQGCKTLFLYRDGVINKLRPNDYVKTWEEFEFLPDVLDSFPILANHFEKIIIISNQRGVGRGLMKEATLKDLHNKMCHKIIKNGGRIDKIYYCTATQVNAPNRKPNI